MPFETDNLLFGSEFDPSGLVKGAEAAANALLKVGTAQETVNTALAEGQTQMTKTTEVATTMKTTFTEAEKVVKKFSDTANKPITPTLNSNKINETLAVIKANFDKTLSGFNFEGFEELETKLANAKDEFEGLNIVIEEAKKKLATLKPNTKEFDDLNKIVSVGTEMLKNYGKATEQTETKTKSLRSRIKELKDELTRLEDTGQENTETYKRMQLEAARLTDQYGDMQAKIKILSSDTKLLDFGLAAANVATAGFQTYTGALALFGVESEDAQKIQTKLLAVMNLVQGAQQLQNLLLKENILQTLGANAVSKAYAATQKIVALALGTTAGASRTLSAALLATGIGALVVGIGFLISKLIEWQDETDAATAAQEKLNAVIEQQGKFFEEDLKQIDNQTNVRNEKLRQRGLSEAAIFESNQLGLLQKGEALNARLATLQEQRATADAATSKNISDEQIKLLDEGEGIKQQLILNSEKEKTRIAEDARKKNKEISDKAIADAKSALEQALKLQQQIALELSLRGKTDEDQELIKLKTKFDEEKAILVKAKQDTSNLETLYQGQRFDIIHKYSLLRAEEERRINEELLNITLDEAEKRIANIEDEFKREGAAIELEFQKEKEALQSKQTSLLNALLTDRNNNVISPAEYDLLVEKTNTAFDRLFSDLFHSIADKKKDLAAKLFQASLQGINDLAISQSLTVGNDAARQRTNLANEFTAGKISYEKYQKAITEITDRETLTRLQIEKAELETQQALLLVRATRTDISQKEKDAIIKQEQEIEAQINKTNEAIANGNVKLKQDNADDTFLQRFTTIANAYTTLTTAVVGFYTKVSQAQQSTLNREISFQQTRVENARIVAERGNAEYLELEQKRLDELERKRAAAAQKQIAINNALVLSEATIAAISAIAKATQEGSAIYAIAALAAVIGAIAAAYSFVNSLEPQSTQFFEGTPFVEKGLHKAGKDTIPARVNIGEAIIPTDTNAAYNKAVKAIYYKQVPASVLNEFVDRYNTFEPVPATDYNRLSMAVDSKGILSLEETNKKLDGIYNVLESVSENLSHADNLHLSLDQNGFTISIIKALRYKFLRSKL